MAKTIELLFNNNLSKVVKLTVDNPIDPINPVQVKGVMNIIVAANIFGGKSGTLVSPKEARLVEHNVTSYELV